MIPQISNAGFNRIFVILVSFLLCFDLLSEEAKPANNGGTDPGQPKNANSETSKTVGTTVSNAFIGLKATTGWSRGVVDGGAVKLELTSSITSTQGISVSLTNVTDGSFLTNLAIQEIVDKGLIVTVPEGVTNGLYRVGITVLPDGGSSVELKWPHLMRIEHLSPIIIRSLIPLAAVAAIIWLILFCGYEPAPGERSYNVIKILFLDPQTNTYSLSRTQFILWSSAIAWAYVFIFFARGLVEDIWTFPSLSGFGITFLISLGTLIGAQATTAVKGSKGTGDAEPTLADLVLHGGVLALERVQQVLWTIIGIGLFIWVVMKNYAASTTVPKVPDELLYLMGLSSAGYLAGKAVRKPGPVIDRVRVAEGSVILAIEGEHLSQNACVWTDGIKQPGKVTVATSDPDAPKEFAKEIRVVIADMANVKQWLSQEHSVTIVNADDQRAEWESSPVVKAVMEEPDGDDIYLILAAEYLGPKATIEVTGVESFEPVERNQNDPTQWRVRIKKIKGQAQTYEEIVVRDSKARECVYKWRPQSSEDPQRVMAPKTGL